MEHAVGEGVQVLRDEQHVDDDCAEECDVDGQSNNVSAETKMASHDSTGYTFTFMPTYLMYTYLAIGPYAFSPMRGYGVFTGSRHSGYRSRNMIQHFPK